MTFHLVPNYELVSLHHDFKNKTHENLKINVNDIEHDLQLEPIRSVLLGHDTPVWTTEYDKFKNDVLYVKVENVRSS